MKEENHPQVIKLNRFSMTSFIGIDLGHLNKNEQLYYNSKRGVPGWLKELSENFIRTEQFGFQSPHFDESQYAKTDRVGRNTFSSYFEYNLMPLVFDYSSPLSHHEGLFECYISSLRIGPRGALSVRIESELKIGDRTGELPSVEDLIGLYYQLRNSLRIRLPAFINKFIECWNGNFDRIYLEKLNNEDLETHSHLYEVIDCKLDFSDGPVKELKQAISENNVVILKQLAGLSRMSRGAFWNYDETRLDSFKDADVSNRDDELWVVNEERLLRYHPEAGRNIYIDSFFEDVKLGFEILVQQEVSLEYLNAWIASQRVFFRKKLSGQNIDQSINEQESDTILADIAHLSDIFSDPFVIQRNVKHSFYNTVLRRAIQVMDIENYVVRARESFSDFFSVSSAYSSMKLAQSSMNIAETELKLSQSTKRLSVGIYALTIVMVFLMVVQIYIASIGTKDVGKNVISGQKLKDSANIEFPKTLYLKDFDNDGIPYIKDRCPNTPIGAKVNDNGCWCLSEIFISKSYKISNSGLNSLKEVTFIMKKNPFLKILIIGHCDISGSKQDNLELSKKRAKAVFNALVDHGIDENRLSYTGFGSEMPYTSSDNNQWGTKNQLIELKTFY